MEKNLQLIIKVTILLLVLMYSNSGFGRNRTLDSLNSRISMLENSIRAGNETISKSIETMRVLNERLSQANDTINYQSSIVGSFETIYAILTIIFTLIGLLVPIVTYYYGIKPSREQIKNLETSFDKRLEEYIKTSRNENVDKAINNLSNKSAEIQQNAITYLTLTQHEGLTDIQYFKLYKVLTSTEIDSAQKPSLGYILTGKENDFATEYCQSILRSRSLYNEHIPARYFGMIGITKYINDFTDYLGNVAEPNETFFRIIAHMKIVSFNAVIELLNSESIVRLLDKDSLIVKDGLIASFEQGYQQDQLRTTRLYKLVSAT